MPRTIVSLLIFIALSLTACASLATPTPTPVPLSSSPIATSKIDLIESPTPTLPPTSAPTPTPTPTPNPYIISATNATEIIELDQLGKGEIAQIAWAPDGTFFSVSSATGIFLYDGKTMDELGQIASGNETPLAISPNGHMLAAPNANELIDLWDIDTGQLLITLKGDAHSFSALAFNPDGKIMAAATWDNETIYLWEVATGEIVTTLQGITDDSVIGGIGTFGSLAFSPDGRVLAAGRPDTRILLWDTNTGQLLHTLTWLEDINSNWEFSGYSTVSFNSSGKLLAEVSEGREVRIWDVGAGQLLFTLEGETHIPGLYPPKCLVFDQEENTLVYGAGTAGPTRGLIRSWDMDTGQLQSEIEVTGHVQSISPDGDKFISERKGVLYLGDTQTGEILQVVEGYTNDVQSIAFNPDGTKLLSGGQGGIIRIWDVANGFPLHTIEADTRWIFSLAYNPGGDTFITGESDPYYQLRVWDSASGELLHSLSGHTESIFNVVFSPDGKTFATSSWDNTVLLWSIDEGLKNLVFDNLTAHVLTFNHDGQKLLIGGRSFGGRDWDFESLVVFDLASKQLLTTFDWVNRDVTSIVVSPDGKTIAIGESAYNETNHYDGRGRVSIGDIETGQKIRILIDNGQHSSDLAFNPSGQLLAITSGSTIQLWEVNTGTQLATFETSMGHRHINSIVFSPNGKIIATGDTAGVIRFWGLSH